jgi:hypothetical protein
MNIYCKDKILEDGTIIYTKENFNLDEYDITEKDNKIIFTPKKKIIKIDKVIENIKDLGFEKGYFTKSKIIDCYINDKRPTQNDFNAIISNVHKIIGDGSKVIKRSILNTQTKNITTKGFCYNEDLEISFQRVDANKAFLEIVKQCFINKITLNIEIKFIDGKIICFEILHK